MSETKTDSPTVTQVVQRKNKDVKPKKICMKCAKIKPLTQFYMNRDWKDQQGYDIWCKQCVSKCNTKDKIKEYIWTNNRQWNEKMWQMAERSAIKVLVTNVTYQRANEQRKKFILQKMTASYIPKSLTPFYKYVDNSCNGKYASYEQAKSAGKVQTQSDQNEKTFSREFNGWFNRHDLQYLQSYYQRLQQDFSFQNQSTRDYARKVCKASLQADKAQDAYAAGRADISTVKETMAQFDMLSKSANFAACKRKAGDASGLTSWAETTLKLQTTGHTMQRKIEWQEDDVDRTINEFKHFAIALNLDSV